MSATVERARRVSSIELFFDLVFVFAFTQVTTFWLEHTSWGGLGARPARAGWCCGGCGRSDAWFVRGTPPYAEDGPHD